MTRALLLVTLAIFAYGSAPAPITASGAFFALSVADLDASAKWYASTFDMSVAMQVPKQGNAAVTVLKGHGMVVELVQLDGAKPISEVAPGITDPMHVHGIAKAGILVDDFPAALAALQARHVTIAYGPFPEQKDQSANVIIKDNSGNLIQVIAR
jgi:catechol 2,3-dioxygenase-like lactoylglutathione lyase family enzyme